MTSVQVDAKTYFLAEDTMLPGVRRVAEIVMADISAVVGGCHGWLKKNDSGMDKPVIVVLAGTIGQSQLLDEFEQTNKINLDAIKNKREVYQLKLIEHPLPGITQAVVIAGSDKRGTIYGLFHLSEILGVSPFINWSGLKPIEKSNVVLTEKDEICSKEPSVKYRGFFINDEWPAFGNWAMIHFGGVNAKCYAQLFELLLRLKGNYLWPAMWSTNFSTEGPGLASAELADELGVVMSTSHHEPCMRSGEEYTAVRGKDSPYGDAWDFVSNPEGITRFWRDGLQRNAKFENVITMGMRGERDTAIMRDATMSENITLLKNVLKTQNNLIKSVINPDLNQVPRQIVMFNEVENFFYGTEETPGLIGSDELDGVTVMFSDNNLGYMRTLPASEIRQHNGGYGMYYHMDMHGGPTSYEWIGSTSLPRIWDQISTAYDFGIQDIWVVNVGDLATNELSLSYFLALANDAERYGSTHPNNTEDYLRNWIDQQFGSYFDSENLVEIKRVINDYSVLLERRKHEVMNDQVYHPVHFGEADEVLNICARIIDLSKKLREICPEEALPGFVELIYYPAVATANLMKTWILTGKNHFYAQQNRCIANDYAKRVKKGIDEDRQIVSDFHKISGGKFDGLGLSEHFGFTQWSAADNKYPICYEIEPANLPRMIVSSSHNTAYSIGQSWTNQKIIVDDFMKPDISIAQIDIACGSQMPVHFKINSDCNWLEISRYQGTTSTQMTLTISIDRQKINGYAENSFHIISEDADVEVIIKAWQPNLDYPSGAFVEANGYLAMDAIHYQDEHSTINGHFVALSPYGKTGTAMKVLPQTSNCWNEADRPYLEYQFVAEYSEQYNLQLYLAPTLPVDNAQNAFLGIQMNNDPITLHNTVHDLTRPFFNGQQWAQEGVDDVKIFSVEVTCHQGLNRFRYFHVSPNMVLERIVLASVNQHLPESYLGPTESYRIVKK